MNSSTVNASPQGPWPLWRRNANLCGVSGWDGLVNLDGSADDCEDYYAWMQPPFPTGPRPADDTYVWLDVRRCDLFDDRATEFHSSRQWVVVVNSSTRRILGCRLVQVSANPYAATVDGTPVGTTVPCDGIWQVE